MKRRLQNRAPKRILQSSLKYILLFLVRFYQLTLSPFLGKCCRFYPSCSDYGIEAIQKHGAWKGLSLILKRIGKCHPWHPGGTDRVP